MSEHDHSLPIDAVSRANGNARRDGAFAGLTAGLLGAIIGGRLGLSRRNTLVAGIIAGILSGYQFTQGFTAANMSRLRAEVAAAQEAKPCYVKSTNTQHGLGHFGGVDRIAGGYDGKITRYVRLERILPFQTLPGSCTLLAESGVRDSDRYVLHCLDQVASRPFSESRGF
ncbi:hypothetical protein BJV78DRAFT_1156769 [Lactifluus subvellereus]|nr:hypothetical protein BJV78DRAFT_1156769 [Lactifluus subvellereus]